ncbi:hypothetical protein [Dyadobacter sandarakinus]|uniref:Secreted protein n=1 Tax=Dyadobacter sandarakinus TaxID=2747268 RepID=A0ABX7I7X0_9BACT|nr:hypothetical protein [Dyadobacter sandarakinus]QRR02184.1 hypothetical protein HWI92_15350 [Dyadobacter sandarakinus]
MMRIFYKILFLVCFCFPAAYGQLTIFNVSSSEITEKNGLSFQQQFEVQDVVVSTTTMTYGLGKDWEAGVNVFNIDYEKASHHFIRNDSTTHDPYAPLVLINSQKLFEITNFLGIGIGGQAGTNISRNKHFVYFTYGNLAASLADKRYKLAAGGYYGNNGYLGEGKVAGFQAGLDAGIWYEKIHLLADWLSGDHAKGALSAGIGIYFFKKLPISAGWQRSNFDGSQGWVLQLTYVP